MIDQETKFQDAHSPDAQHQDDQAPLNPETRSSKRAGMSKLTAAILICLIVVLLVAGGFLYYRIFKLSQHAASALVSFSHQIKWNQHQISELQSEYAVLQQRLQQQDQALQRQAQMIQTYHGSAHNAAADQGQEYAAALEAQYFIRLAMDQLLLTNDIPQALNFLTQAQAELSPLTDAKLAPLKKALEEDIASLKKMPWTNLSDLYQRLVSVQKQIGKLPMLIVPTQNAETTATSSSEEDNSTWTQGLKHFWDALKKMVTIYHLPTKNTPPFVTPDLRPFIFENLRALLNDATWAVLYNNPGIYHSSLEQTADWIRQYFSLSSPLTANVLNELQALQTASVQQTKEVVLASPKVFQDFLKAESAPAAPSK